MAGRAGHGKELIIMRMRTAGWWPRSGLARLGGPSPRRGLRVVVLAVIVGAVGVTAGSAAAVGPQVISLRLAYSCAFSSGSQLVNAQVTATFPATGTTGKPIQPTGTALTVTLPHVALADLVRSKAATVMVTAALSAGFTEGSRSATVAWRNLRSAAADIPRTGPLTLTAAGTVSPVTIGTPGEVTVSAADLALVLTASGTDGSQASPPATQVACSPRAGQDTTLARIAVAGPAQVKGSASPADDPAKCLPFPKHLKLNPLFPLPPPLPGSKVFHTPENGCAYAAGFTNVQKLHEAALVGPGLTDFKLGQAVYTKFAKAYSYIQIREPGQLEYHGLAELPPARATFLAFGFMPVSATQQISEIGTVNADLITCGPVPAKCPKPPPKDPPQKNIALFFVRVSLGISDVDVNGVPLNVGPHCQTSPFNLVLTGVPPTYNVASQYGVLTGTVTVPPFTGCGVGENLDSIFTASVSGPGNFVKVTQAVFCTPVNGGGCPPAKPHPKH
jgi:hypothetical protein